MRRLLDRIWGLPWPDTLRRASEPVLMASVVQRVLVPHFRVGVVAVVRDDAGEYLLFRHTYRNSCPWGLPTGFLEHGEQPSQALSREIFEESGLTVDLGPIWHVY